MYFNIVTGVAFVSLGCLFSGWMNLTLHSPVSCHCSKVLAKRWWKDRRRKIDLVGSMETLTEEPATISKQHKLTHPRVGFAWSIPKQLEQDKTPINHINLTMS